MDVASRRQPVAEPLRVKVRRCVVHVLAAPAVLARTHELVVDAAGAPTRCLAAPVPVAAALALLVDDGHPVEVVLRQVEVFARLILHVLALVVIHGQLLYFEAVFVVDLVRHAPRVHQLALSLPARLAVVVVRERYLRVRLVRRDLVAVHV